MSAEAGNANKPRVAVLGLGTMGSGMAAQLLAKGFSLSVYNRSASKTEPLRASGARVGSTPADAAKNADFIVSMLSDDDGSRNLWMGSDGALTVAKQGAILIECGTVTVDWVLELDTAAKARGCKLLDAPVTGSRAAAEGGELNFLVGGDAETLEKAMPVLNAMGRSATLVGPSGSGARLKLINNFLCGVQLASIAEAVGWIERSGLDLEKCFEVLGGGAPGSPMLKTMSGRMAKREYGVNFALHLLAKDMRYAQQDANGNGVDLVTVNPVRELLNKAEELGFGEQDMSSVVEQFRSKETQAKRG